MEEKIVKSSLPYYTIGLVWLLVGLILPMHTITAWLVAVVASIGVFALTYKVSPDKVVMVKVKIVPTGIELADEYIKIGRDSTMRISEISLVKTDIEQHSEKISEVLEKIVAFIQKYPQKARNLNSFMDYYLPTTIKLMENYRHLISQGQLSENISASKQKIEDIMPTMVKVFENQLDALFEDKAMDISAEIKVLRDFLGDSVNG